MSGVNFVDLANTNIGSLRPYQPGKPIQEVAREYGITHISKLASNENPLGCSPLAIDAMQAALRESQYYPDGSGYILKNALSNFLNIPQNHLTLGNGSDNLLALIAQVFLKPGHTAVVSQYGFDTFGIVTKANHGKVYEVPAKNYGHDLEQMAKVFPKDTDLFFLANPNNPTGTYFSQSTLETFLAAIPNTKIVVLDEAYYEFADAKDYPQSLKLLERFPNLIITRTFSKAYGLAGIRVGYAISNPEISDLLNRVRLPFNVSHIGLVAATAAINDQAFVEATKKNNHEGKQQLIAAFDALQLHYEPTQTNFLLTHLKQPAQSIYQDLLKQGVIVRPLLPYGLPEHLRVSIGTQTQNQHLIDALLKIKKG